MPRILLLVDHKVRDLPRLALLKALLEDECGHEVALMPRVIDPIKAARRWLPDLIVFPFLRGHKWIRRVRHLHQAGVQCAVLSSEYWYGQFDERAKALAESDVVREIDRLSLYFANHPALQTAMEGHYGRRFGQIEYVGNPSFDFYVPPLRALLARRETFLPQHGLDPAQPVLLVVTSFPQANYLSDTPEEQQRSIAFWRTASRDVVIENQVVHRQLMMDAVAAIARRYPALNLLFRPHPFEMMKPPGYQVYRDFFAQHGLEARLRLVPEGHISHLLNVSDLVLYSWSTTALEAWLLDLPTVALRTDPFIDQTLDSTVGQLSQGDHVVHTVAEAVQAIGHYLEGGRVSAEIQQQRGELLAYHLPHPPGQISRQIAQHINAVLGQKSGAVSRQRLYGVGPGLAQWRAQWRYWRDHLAGRHASGPLDDNWEAWPAPSARIPSLAEMDAMVSRIRAARTGDS